MNATILIGALIIFKKRKKCFRSKWR